MARRTRRVWDEARHPRDERGRFTDGEPAAGWVQKVDTQLTQRGLPTLAEQRTAAARQRTQELHSQRQGTPWSNLIGQKPTGWANETAAKAAESRYRNIGWKDVRVNGKPVTWDRQRPETQADYTYDQWLAISRWTGDRYCQAATKAARSGNLDGGTTSMGVYVPFADFYKSLDSAIGAGTLSRDSILWRGLALHPGEAQKLFQPGTIVEDLAPVAASFSQSGAKRIVTHRIAQAKESAEHREG